ncbi:MAG: hypothetical protein KTR31_25110 [Myxococcales bacterium]|nr:hypothetical protein [Myxococcales bacterium]
MIGIGLVAGLAGCGPGVGVAIGEDPVADTDVLEPITTDTTPPPSTTSTPSPTTPSPTTEGPGFPAVTDFEELGPYETVVDAGLSEGCLVHRPETLGEAELPHPVVLWADGVGDFPALYSELLAHLASHGFVVAAAEEVDLGSGVELLGCLDALSQASDEPDSVYSGWLDLERVAAMGHDQGANGALMAGTDPRVHATVPVQPFYELPLAPFGFDKEAIAEQQGPMLLLSGEDDDVAVPDVHQEPIYEGTTVDVIWATRLEGTHRGPLFDGGPFRLPITAWLRFRFMDDALAAEAMDDPCTLCDDEMWDVLER